MPRITLLILALQRWSHHIAIELLVNMYFTITDCDHVLTFMWPIIVTWGQEVGSTPLK